MTARRTGRARAAAPAGGLVTYVIGHKNPDTDSIVSAVAYAELLRAQGQEVVAARAGHLNAQTAFILAELGVPAPVYLADARVRAGEAMVCDYIRCTEHHTLHDALEIFRRYGFRYLPVVGADGRPRGCLTLELITRGLLRLLDTPRVFTSLAMLTQALEAQLLATGGDPARTFKAGMVLTTGTATDFTADLRAQRGECLVITDDRFDLLRRLPAQPRLAALICVDGYRPPAALVRSLARRGTAVLLTGFGAAQATLRIKQALPVASFYDRQAATINQKMPLADCRGLLGDAGGVLVVDDDGRLCGIVTEKVLVRRPAHRLILVDHNEPAQAVDGSDEAEIIGVVDHHRIAPGASARPIAFLNYPVGSTATVVATLFRERGRKPRRATAKLLLAGILSDTVLLKSPTTTVTDRDMVRWLAGLAKFNHEKFALAFFAAGAKIDPARLEQTIAGDFKEYAAGAVRFGIGQLETVGYAAVEPYFDRLAAVLATQRRQAGLRLSGLMVTDISSQTSVLLADGEPALLALLPFRPLAAGRYDLRDFISRKKQLIPLLLRLLAEHH